MIAAFLLLFSIPEAKLYAFNGSSTSSSTDTTKRTLHQTEWADMLPHTKQGSYYNEFWVYHVFLENNLQLHITFSLANFGSFKSAVSGGRLFVSNFKGNDYHMSREYPLEKFEIDEELHRIRLHPERNIYFGGELPNSHNILYQTSKNDVSYLVDLSFDNISRGYTRDDGIFKLDDDEMGLFIHIPKASVSGTVAINDDTLEVKGTAYMDHTYQTNLSSKLVDKGFRHITHTEDGFSTGYYLIPKDRSEAQVVGLGLVQSSTVTELETPRKITILESQDIDDRSIPSSIEILYESGKRRTLERTQDFQHVSFLGEIGGLRKRLVRSFLGGEIIEYVGLGRLDGNIPANYNFLIVH